MLARNIAIVVAVVIVVAGVAWFRATQATPGAGGAASSAPSAPADKALPRLVDLGAGKCKACKELAPIIDELRKEYAGRVTVEFIDVWADPAAAELYSIRVIPTQIFYDANGKEVWRHEGFWPKEEFVKRFTEAGVK